MCPISILVETFSKPWVWNRYFCALEIPNRALLQVQAWGARFSRHFACALSCAVLRSLCIQYDLWTPVFDCWIGTIFAWNLQQCQWLNCIPEVTIHYPLSITNTAFKFNFFLSSSACEFEEWRKTNHDVNQSCDLHIVSDSRPLDGSDIFQGSFSVWRIRAPSS